MIPAAPQSPLLKGGGAKRRGIASFVAPPFKGIAKRFPYPIAGGNRSLNQTGGLSPSLPLLVMPPFKGGRGVVCGRCPIPPSEPMRTRTAYTQPPFVPPCKGDWCGAPRHAPLSRGERLPPAASFAPPLREKIQHKIAKYVSSGYTYPKAYLYACIIPHLSPNSSIFCATALNFSSKK